MKLKRIWRNTGRFDNEKAVGPIFYCPECGKKSLYDVNDSENMDISYACMGCGFTIEGDWFIRSAFYSPLQLAEFVEDKK